MTIEEFINQFPKGWEWSISGGYHKNYYHIVVYNNGLKREPTYSEGGYGLNETMQAVLNKYQDGEAKLEGGAE